LTPIIRFTSIFFLCLLQPLALLSAQSATQPSSTQDAAPIFVIYLTRHGVRSPTGKPEQYSPFSVAPWPAWNVSPGYLTEHGYRLMRDFGAWDRQQLAGEGLLAATGCDDAARVTFYADSDQRTRETGKALAEGLFPGCATQVRGLPEGTHDPLFHPLGTQADSTDPSLSLAAILGRIGGNPANLTDAYRTQLSELDSILSKCGDPPGSASAPIRQSILNIPATLEHGNPGHPVELRGPLSAASTLTENFLLEYTEGMDLSNVGWGCVNGENLRSLMQLHAAESEFTQRPAPIARVLASNLLHQILLALEQAAAGKRISGAVSRVNDRALFLIGHDTNIATVAGLLDLHWIADGQPDGTPPGGALVFELWRSRIDRTDSVRVYYTAQSLEQMRAATVLTQENPPVRVPIFIPSCSRPDLFCSLADFEESLERLTTKREP